MNTHRITVAGASGRMGRALVRAIAESGDLTLAFAIERKGHADLGADSGTLAGIGANNILLSDDLVAALAASDALLDFTAPASLPELVK